MPLPVNKVLQSLEKYKARILHVAIVLIIVLLEHGVDTFVFTCICIDNDNTTVNNITWVEFLRPLNRWYAYACLFGPAFLLILLSAVLNSSCWRQITGCTKRSTGGFRGFTFFKDFLHCVLPGVAWICVAFLDGEYFACAVSKTPYSLNSKRDCTAKVFSDEFEENRIISQIIGWTTLAAFGLIYFLVYLLTRCCLPYTYYQAMYYEQCIQEEDEQLKKEIQKKAEEFTGECSKLFMNKRIESNDVIEWEKKATPVDIYQSKNYFANMERWRKNNAGQNDNASSSDLNTRRGADIQTMSISETRE